MARSPDRRDRDRYSRDHRDDRGGHSRKRSRSPDDRDGRDAYTPEHKHRRHDRYDDSRSERHDDRRGSIRHDRHSSRDFDDDSAARLDRRTRDYDSRDERHHNGQRSNGHYRSRREESPARSRDRDHDRDRSKREYKEASPVRDRPDDRHRYQDRRGTYDDRHRKTERRGSPHNHRASDGRLTPESFSTRRSMSPPRRKARFADEVEDEGSRKAARLAKVEALKAQRGVKPALVDGNASDQQADRSFARSMLKASRSGNQALQEEVTKRTAMDIKKRAAQKLAEQVAAARSAAQDEDDGTVADRRTLKELPTFAETAAQTDQLDDEDDEDMQIESDDENNTAAQEKAQERAMAAYKQEAIPDVVPDAEPMVEDNAEDEELDPLDAFMDTLERPAEEGDILKEFRVNRSRRPTAFNTNDDGMDLDAVGISMLDKTAFKKRKKDLVKVDHSTIEYDTFRKEFWSEPEMYAEMTEEDLEAIRANELDNTKVGGVDVPKPILTWPHAGFSAQVLEVIEELKYEKPSAIQAQALSAIMSGRDTLGVAKTGSGKTMAYLLPMFRHVKDQPPPGPREGPIALILAPTRELAVQIHKDCKPFLKVLKMEACCAYGGAQISDQIAELKRGPEIVVATPGRLIDLLIANGGRVTNLGRVTYLVLDEADRMFDMGFEPQITRILDNIRPNKQTVLFSATFPKTMESLARKTLIKPVEIIVGGRSIVAPEIEQTVEVLELKDKFPRLLSHLGENHKNDDESRSLIFVERHEHADQLHVLISKAGYRAHSIHGGREQADRDYFISEFKKGNVPILIATSVAARGLDVKHLTLVVNYDCPNHREDYVHRCGRTGRAGATGTAVTFIQPDQDRFAPWLVRALEDSKKKIPDDLKALAGDHETKLKSGAAKAAHNGFGGHGIERLEAARRKERREWTKGFDKDGNPVPVEAQEQDAVKVSKDANELLASATSTVLARDETPLPKTNNVALRPDLDQLLKDAMNITKTEGPARSTNAPQARGGVSRAQAMIEAINNRLGSKGATRPGVPVGNHGPDAGAFSATLEVNDFPPKARWEVTNRTNVAAILEATGVSITSKGQFYASGGPKQAGDPPKLYMLVEGDTKVAVETAMRKLTDSLRKGLLLDEEAKSKAATSGRYSVV